MKKSLPLLALLSLAALGRAQVSYTEGFNDLGANGDDFNISNLLTRGWAETNLSDSASGAGPFANGDAGTFAPHAGAGYISTDYHIGNGTLSAWLFTPTDYLTNGSVFTFYTRTITPGATVYPDSLELRLSTNGSSTNVGANSTSTGDFTTLLVSINPTQSSAAYPIGYPTAWTQYTAVLAGLPVAGVSGRLAFHYDVPNGGVSGVNGNYIGIDDVSYTGIPLPVPEPTTVAALGLAALATLRRRRK